MSKKERQNVRDELFDHLMCKYETNLAVGMDEEKAAERAINDLGNKNALKEKLQKVHWYYPAQSMKTAFYYLLVALVLPMITLGLATSEYFFELSQIVSIVALLLEFAAFFMLRTVSKKFAASYKFCIISTALTVVQTALQPFLNDYIIIDLVALIIILVFSVLKIGFMFSALNELLKRCENTKIIKETVLFYCTCFVYTFGMLGNRSSDNPFLHGLIFSVLTVASYILFVVRMLKISDVLYKSEEEYKVDISGKKVLTVTSIAAVLIFSLIFAGDYAYSSIKINKSENIPYSVNDIEMEDAEYERICNNISSYGINKNFVSIMPKSEIMKYRDIVNKSELTESAQGLLDYYDNRFRTTVDTFDYYFGDDMEKQITDNVMVRNFALGLGRSETGGQLVRFIKIFCVPSAATEKYKDTVLFEDFSDKIHEMFPLFDETPRCGDMLVAMKIDGNKLYKRDVKILNEDELDKPIEGFMFDVEPGMIIIYASTRKIQDMTSTLCNVNYTYYHQRYPVMFPIRDVKNIFIFENFFAELSTYTVYRYNTSYHYYVMPDCEYYVPEEKKEEETRGVVVVGSMS